MSFQPNRERTAAGLGGFQRQAMLKRIARTGIMFSLCLAAGAAWCQSNSSSLDSFRDDRPCSAALPCTELRTWQALPDAPSWSLKYRAQPDKTLAELGDSNLPARLILFSNHADSLSREAGLTPARPGRQPRQAVPWSASPAQEASVSTFTKFLYLPLLKHNLDYHPATGGSFVGRASYAASRIFFTREDSGKGKLNPSYFLAALTAATVQTACRPYWARSSSETFNNFGSTIGSDAGMNVLHEFEPGIRQIVKAHTPRILSSIEARIAHDQQVGDGSLTTALGRP